MIQCEVCHWTAVAADIFTIIGVLVVGTLGILAYTSWKRELTGTDRYKLAQRVLLAVYSLREAVNDFRTPLGGWPVQFEGVDSAYWSNMGVLERKWQRVLDTIPGVDNLIIETEVLIEEEKVPLLLDAISSFPYDLYADYYEEFVELWKKFVERRDEFDAESDLKRLYELQLEIFGTWWRDKENDRLYVQIKELEDELKKYFPSK